MSLKVGHLTIDLDNYISNNNAHDDPHIKRDNQLDL